MQVSNFGERLLPSLVDEIAANDPTRVLYSVTKTKDPADGFQDITAAEFAQAVDRCAWHLHDSLGPGENFPTIMYMGPQDLVYGILVLASNKAGYKLLLNSPRNTLEAHLSLLEQTDCHVFLQPPVFPLPVVKQIEEARPMKVVIIPGLQHWIGAETGEHRPYPYNRTFAEARLEPFVVLHTSGSTGLPKPIIQRHGTHSPLDAFNTLPAQGLPASYPAMCSGTRVYNAFPLFHCAGITMLLPGPIYNEFTAVLGPFPPSADVADGVHVHGNVQHSCIAPMTIIDLAKDPQHLENLSRLQQITYGGGPCPPAIGKLVSTKTRLLDVLGTTECGTLPIQLSAKENWAYMTVSPLLGAEYREVADGLFEQVIVRKPELQKYQGVFATFPDLQEWPMKDLYSKHPTDEDVWLYKGRSDDIIVLHTGEKFNPIDFENIVGANSAVASALVAGLGRFQTSLLIEATKPPTTDAEKEELINAIWPSVEEANEKSPSHAQLHRELILFTTPEKPMLRAGKGTVQRSLTVDSYKAELDALYETNEKGYDAKGVAVNGDSSESGIHAAVREIVITSAKLRSNKISSDADLFELGLDSLQVTVIARCINNLLLSQGKQPSFNARTVYANPSIAALTSTVLAILHNQQPETTQEDVIIKLKDLNSLYTSELPIPGRQPAARPSDKSVVLLTGATGSLGSYILDSLMKNTRVDRIYLLNRGADSQRRQAQSLASKGLADLTDRVTIIEAELTQPYFGLTAETFRKILGEVTDVIHNAWKVDFNLAIDSFASQVGAVRRIINFSSQSTYGAKIVFISSVSAVAGLSSNASEKVYDDWNAPAPTGYGQSKFVSELVLDEASKHVNVPVDILRIGQIAGPRGPEGVWPKQEWFPSLIASSKHLGIIPDSLGRMNSIDWVPVDVLGQSIVEATLAPTKDLADKNSGATVFHISNPQHTEWAKLLPVVTKSLGSDVKVVPLGDWVAAVKQSEAKATDDDIAKNPAVKLVDFFEDLAKNDASEVTLQVKNVLEVSKTLAELEPVGEIWLNNWLAQWNF
mgnify:CR=1 FL=1